MEKMCKGADIGQNTPYGAHSNILDRIQALLLAWFPCFHNKLGIRLHPRASFSSWNFPLHLWLLNITLGKNKRQYDGGRDLRGGAAPVAWAYSSRIRVEAMEEGFLGAASKMD